MSISLNEPKATIIQQGDNKYLNDQNKIIKISHDLDNKSEDLSTKEIAAKIDMMQMMQGMQKDFLERTKEYKANEEKFLQTIEEFNASKKKSELANEKQMREMQKNNDETKRESAETKRKLAETNKELEVFKAKVEAHEKTIADNSIHIIEQDNKYLILTELFNNIAAEKRQLEARIAELEKENQEKSELITLKDKRIIDLSAEFENERARVEIRQGEINLKNAQIQELETKLWDKSAQKDILGANQTLLEITMQGMKSDYERVVDARDALLHEKKDIEGVAIHLKEKIDKKKKKNEELKFTIKKLEMQVNGGHNKALADENQWLKDQNQKLERQRIANIRQLMDLDAGMQERGAQPIDVGPLNLNDLTLTGRLIEAVKNKTFAPMDSIKSLAIKLQQAGYLAAGNYTQDQVEAALSNLINDKNELKDYYNRIRIALNLDIDTPVDQVIQKVQKILHNINCMIRLNNTSQQTIADLTFIESELMNEKDQLNQNVAAKTADIANKQTQVVGLQGQVADLKKKSENLKEENHLLSLFKQLAESQKESMTKLIELLTNQNVQLNAKIVQYEN